MTAEAPAPPAIAPVSKAYRRYALSVLLVIYILNFLDRQIVAILAEPIKHDLGLADWQLGVMTGLAFALFYTVLGIPIARYAETGHRPRIIAVAAGLWSLFTLACGYAQNFVQLVACRVGVGIGEAGCTPPAHSLITDYTPREKRASALAFYALGTPLGGLLGLALGGLIADAYGWRTAFLFAGLPGLLMALVAWTTLREPRRQMNVDLAALKAARPDFKTAMAEIRGKRTFWLIAFAAAIKAFIGYGAAAFLAPFFFRNHAAELTVIADDFGLGLTGFLGVALGIVLGLTGAVGTWMGGYLADKYGARDLRFYVAIPAVSTLIGIPFYIAGLLSDSAVFALIMFAFPPVLNTMWYGPGYAAVQGLVQPQTRATASAVLLFIINLIGLGLGPLGVGAVSDFISGPMGLGSAEGVRWSLMIFILFGAVASGLFWLARRSIREEMVS
ncbi:MULTISPECIES: MFS transporter [unclassified Sphingopyxis]|uniref:spinster family MFS transporter n=1 Tax=unclassified Sphingopyxis TaxID=2614943 RepID=UPI0007306177|nr:MULTISPECIES: MFS transporter [unclassified Sphingopyxis]KTE23972.1 MFS transporter [Sphingopyxis sp. H057]KTE51125.1 MFS transporter [Sphingopyxis sp. H073]KTE51339.1 MFS transporter [Sphingopyxis sp. H071]KTE59062.1 MFS transporter [Sphingopyxis sp. H107]KTE63315.1 MFS transporter [Sphingopyxis sp. H100]